jgi:ubiquinone/menaquinone biosynthesis C-methylase UbiE
MNSKTQLPYSAKTAYQDYDAAVEYEDVRFSGLLGRYRRAREAQAITDLVRLVTPGSVILDCPCGTGRWWRVLRERAARIIAVDLSDGMLRFAGERASGAGIEVELLKADAESLPLENESVDVTFSHALTKHLPVPVQYQVLREFSRVSREAVICSFGVFSHITYEFWRRRRIEESYPVLPEELEWMAAFAGLEIRTMRKCTTPLGVERAVLFSKL